MNRDKRDNCGILWLSRGYIGIVTVKPLHTVKINRAEKFLHLPIILLVITEGKKLWLAVRHHLFVYAVNQLPQSSLSNTVFRA